MPTSQGQVVIWGLTYVLGADYMRELHTLLIAELDCSVWHITQRINDARICTIGSR